MGSERPLLIANATRLGLRIHAIYYQGSVGAERVLIYADARIVPTNPCDAETLCGRSGPSDQL
jgi:hypothetical protein